MEFEKIKNGDFKYKLLQTESTKTKIIFPEFKIFSRIGNIMAGCSHIISNCGTVVIGSCIYGYANYRWNGPSGPTIDTKAFIESSLFHDILYQAMRAYLMPITYRPDADKLLFDENIARGMCYFRAWYVHKFVRTFAGFAAQPGSEM